MVDQLASPSGTESLDSAPSTPVPLLRRRNGRPQACHPCRSRKVACDNAQPICVRCRKRNQADKCVYIISQQQRHSTTHPASRLAETHSGGGDQSTASSASASASASHNGPRPSPAGRVRPRLRTTEPSPPPASTSSFTSSAAPVTRVSNYPAITQDTPNDDAIANGTSSLDPSRHAGTYHAPSRVPDLRGRPPAIRDRINMRVPTSGPGYLGFISHSDVYEETRNSLSRLQGTLPRPLPGLGEQVHDFESHPSGTLGTMPPPVREMCLTVLRNLPNLTGKDIVPRRSPHLCDGWIRVAGRSVLRSFQLHSEALVSESHIEEFAERLCSNTAKPVSDDLVDSQEWFSQFVWPNIRWESIGLLFTFREIFIDPSDKPGGLGRNDRYHSSWKSTALTCLSLCIQIANYFSDGNLLLLHLSHRRTIMESMASGDASLPCLRAHAEAVTLMTFMGLHAETDSPLYVPTFCSELKRRLFAHVFILDKVNVSISGRPPLLSRRFCTTPMPLDIPDEYFFADAATFNAALNDISETGWTQTETPHASTMLRGRLIIAQLEEEIQELALGGNKSASVEEILNLKQRESRSFAELPKSLYYRPEEINSLNGDIFMVYSRMLVLVEHMQNLFLIEKVLTRLGHADNGELVRISYEMVALTLTFWTHKDRFADVRADFEWLVISYAAPGGGILCMELLKPTFSGHHPLNSEISRSTIIQKLSMLVGFLSWISPDAPNADMCMHCKTVIQHVLDHALNTVPTSNETYAVLDQFDATQLLFNYDLMDTFDWLRPDDMMNQAM